MIDKTRILDFRERVNLDNLSEEILELINKHRQNLNYAEVLGVLELVKMDVIDCIHEEED